MATAWNINYLTEINALNLVGINTQHRREDEIMIFICIIKLHDRMTPADPEDVLWELVRILRKILTAEI